MSSLYNEWKNKRVFKIETDKFKKKKYIYTSPFKTICGGFNNRNLYPYIVSDLYSKKYRMQGYNVMYPIGINNLNDETLSYSRLRGESFTALKDFYVRELMDMNVGFDEEKLVSYSDNEFIKFTQNIFYQMYLEDFIVLKKLECYTDFSGHTIYPRYMVENKNEKFILKDSEMGVYSKTLEVFALNEEKFPNLLNNIESLNLEQDIKNKLYEILDLRMGLEVSFYSKEKDISLNVKLDNPEEMGGIVFIALNPKYIDIMPYASSDEAISLESYIKFESDNDLYTGVTLKNPLGYNDIYVFASYKFDEAIHVGIPCLDVVDHMFASKTGLDTIDIYDGDILINSDFLNGLTAAEGRKEIIDAFTSEGMANLYSYPKRKEFIISAYDDLGVIIPSVTNYLGEISVIDEKFYPIFYSNRFKPVITNEEKLSSDLQLKRMVFNEGFLLGILNVYERVYDMYAGNDTFLSQNSMFDEFTSMEGFISKSKYVDEIFYNLIFNEYFQRFNKNYKNYESLMVINDTINPIFLGEQQRLGVSFVDEVCSKYSSDAYRLYLLADNLNDELALTLANVEKYEDLIDKIKEAYNTPFEQSMYENSYMQAFIKESNRLLDNHEVKKFTNNLIGFFESFVETHKITKNESRSFLIILSLIAPEISEEIYKIVFKERYSIFYSEFPK